MRVPTSAAALYIASLVAGSTVGHGILPALAPHTPTVRILTLSAISASTPSHITDRLELRQAPGFVPVAAPPAELVAPAVPAAVPPAPLNPPAAVPLAPTSTTVDPVAVPAPAPAAAIPPANQENHPAPPVAMPASLPATSSLPSLPLVTADDIVTVQWVETHIGKLRTWIPKTYTFQFEAMSQAPLPGVGSIGMGTMTGKTGQTQTIYMVAGSAPTSAAGAKKVVVAAVAAGVAGLAV